MWAILFCFLFGISGALSLATAQQKPTDQDAMRQAYENGERALRDGNLPLAKHCFLVVLRLVPEDVGARINLGVVYMRQQDWDQALEYLKEAETRAPQVTGIRLNIGLAEYRKQDYGAAIPAFESVLRDQPDSAQARRLLGLSYLFEQRYSEAAAALEPLWAASNDDLSYLYSLAVAAGNAQQRDWEQRAEARLMEIGSDSPLLHLLHGKAYLAHEDFEHALEEFQTAVRLDPKLPLVHYNMGVVYRREGLVAKARDEFLLDLAMQRDVAFDYDQLGAISYGVQQDRQAESYFRQALKLNPKLGTSWFGLAKIYKQEKRYPEALEAIRQAELIDSNSASAHYLHAQTLTEMGRSEEAKDELATVRRLKRESLDKLEQQVSGPSYHDPEVTAQASE